MISSNGSKNNTGKPSGKEGQDFYEFDQDLKFDMERNSIQEVRGGSAESSIPDFGVIKNNVKPSRTFPKVDTDQLLRFNGQDPEGKNPIRKNKAKDKASKPQRISAKKDYRWRFFFGLILFVTGLAGSIFLVQSNTKGLEVIVATHDILPGQTITNADLTTARMSVPPDLASLLLSGDEINTFLGNNASNNSPKVASRQLRSHQPIMQGDIISSATLNKTGVPEGMVAIALPVSPSTAASRITPGDSVTLIYVNNKSGLIGNFNANETASAEQKTIETRILAEKVTVLDVTRGGSNINLAAASNSNGSSSDNLISSSNRSPITNLTLLVTVDQAQQIAVAKETGTVNVVLLPLLLQSDKNVDSSSLKQTPQISPNIQASPIQTVSPSISISPNR